MFPLFVSLLLSPPSNDPPFSMLVNVGDQLVDPSGVSIKTFTADDAKTIQSLPLNDKLVTSSSLPYPSMIFTGDGHAIWLAESTKVEALASLTTPASMAGPRVHVHFGQATVGSAKQKGNTAGAGKIVIRTTGSTTGAKGTLLTITVGTNTAVSNYETNECVVYPNRPNPNDPSNPIDDFAHPYPIDIGFSRTATTAGNVSAPSTSANCLNLPPHIVPPPKHPPKGKRPR